MSHPLKIVPPTPERIDRLIRSAINTYEEIFFKSTYQKLPKNSLAKLDSLVDSIAYLEDDSDETTCCDNEQLFFHELKADPGRPGLESALKEINKLRTIRKLELPYNLFESIPHKVLKKYRQRVATEDLRELRRHPDYIRYTLLSAFFWLRSLEITDNLIELLIQIIHRIGVRAERKVDREILNDLRRVSNKYGILFNLAQAAIVRRKFIHKDNLRNAIAEVVNAIFSVRMQEIWGEGTTSCASDSKKFGAWDQNLMTEWHIRYRGRGVMIYWHVEKNSTCIYSQLKSCSSSEIAAMIEGLLRHCTDMEVEKNYVDSHGQSEVAFAFCYLLGFQLMPRLKAIHSQKLYRPEPGMVDAFPSLKPVLSRPINWELIRQQYDQMMKYATALRLGTAETEAILKRFTRNNLKHPTYQAFGELGKAVKTIFLCNYLHSEQLRREINEGLNVVENWNSANSFIFYGKGGEISTNRLEDQEIAVLSLHLLQNCLVYVNTLMLQNILSDPKWFDLMTPEDFRALTPLVYTHVNPYGTFRLNMSERLPLKEGVIA